MPVEQRIKMSLLAEKVDKQKTFSEKLGLENVSTLHGRRVKNKEEEKTC